MKYTQLLIFFIVLTIFSAEALSLSRDKIISHAERYATYKWTVLEGNNHSSFNKLKKGQKMQGLPYNWGGWDTIEQFETKIKTGQVAGKNFSKAVNGKAVYPHFGGVDCSGFVTRVWNKKSKYSTSSLPNISKAISWDELKPGDIINKKGSHVRLFHKKNVNGALWFYESSGGKRKVVHRILPRESGYIPRRYNNIEKSDTTSSSISTLKPIITNIIPNRLQALPQGQQQWITIKGKNFNYASRLEFEIVGGERFTNRVPLYKHDTELRYKISVGSKPNKWTVKVVNNKKYSHSHPFTVNLGANYPGKYPEGSSRYLRRADFIGKPKLEMRIMRNEIFARYGFIFKTSDMSGYFAKQAWYHAKLSIITNQHLTDIEIANVKFIQQYEKSLITQHTSNEYPIILIAWLAEIGYLDVPNRLDNQKVKISLLAFQKDSRILATGQLNNETWERLSRISLTQKNKVKLHFLIAEKFKNLNTIKRCDPDLIWTAALLNEMGYLNNYQLENIEKYIFQQAIAAFQKDIGNTTPSLEDTWKRLSTIKLTPKTKAKIARLGCY